MIVVSMQYAIMPLNKLRMNKKRMEERDGAVLLCFENNNNQLFVVLLPIQKKETFTLQNNIQVLTTCTQSVKASA